MSRTHKDTKRFKKEWNNRIGWTTTWPETRFHMGRYMKRRLNKARRRAWKNGPRHQRSLPSLEGEVNYRTW